MNHETTPLYLRDQFTTCDHLRPPAEDSRAGMGYCYLLKIAGQAWYTYWLLLSAEDSRAGMEHMGYCYLLKIAGQAWYTYRLLLSTEYLCLKFIICIAPSFETFKPGQLDYICCPW